MLKKLGKAKVWLVPVLFAIMLAMFMLAFTMPAKANAEDTTTYDVTNITVARNGNANNFYVNATVSSDVPKTWSAHYIGSGVITKSDETTQNVTVGFRVLPDTSTGWFVDTGVTEANTLLTVSGIFTVYAEKTTYTGTLYPLNIETTTFKWDGTSWSFVSREKIKDDTEYTTSIVLGVNGTEASIDTGYHTADANGFFDSAKTKIIGVQDDTGNGTVMSYSLNKKYKSANFDSVKIEYCVSDWNAVGTTVTITAYALSDTDCTTPLASQTVNGNANTNGSLTIPATCLKDSDGYISGLKLKRTQTGASNWQFFTNQITLIPSTKEKVDTKPTDNIVLDADLSNVWLTIDGTKQTSINNDNAWGVFTGATGDTKAIFTDNSVSDGAVITVNLAKRYKAENFSTLRVKLFTSSWVKVGEDTITNTVYSVADTTFTNPAGSTTTGYGNKEAVLEIDALKIAVDGYIDSFVIKRTSNTNGQVFFDYVELIPTAYKITVKDGDKTSQIGVAANTLFTMSNIGATNTETEIVAGYKINDKLYSADYSFMPSADTEIEVVRVAFKLKDGASIKCIGDLGMHFTALLDESDYASLKTIVGESNISFGMTLLKVSTNKCVSKTAEKYYTSEGNIVYNGLLSTIPDTGYEEEFTATAYLEIKYENTDSAVKVYAIANDNTRSVYQVALNAIEKGVTGDAKTVCEGIISAIGGNTSMTETLAKYEKNEDEKGVVIGGWLIPSGLDKDNVSYITDAGIDVLFAAGTGTNADGTDSTIHYDSYTTEAGKVLTMLNENGVKVYINSATTGKEKITQFNHDDVLGVFIDEPNKDGIDTLTNQVDYYNSDANGKTVYVNLLPSYGATGFTTYKDYLKYFCDNFLSKLTTGEKWLSVDRYPLTYDSNGNKCLDSGWLADVQDVVEVAKEYSGIKTNFFIQTMPYGTNGTNEGSRDRVPTLADIRMQEMALMSFGYDGISLFCYGSPSVITNGEFTATQVAMIDRSGNKTDIYEAVKTANAELEKIDHIMLNFEYQSVFTCDAGSSVNGTSSTSNASFTNLTRASVSDIDGISSVSATADTLFGYFKDSSNNIGFTVVNYNDTSKNLTDTVTITFDSSKYDTVIYYEKGIKRTVTLTNGVFTIELGVGEGIFVIPCKAN